MGQKPPTKNLEYPHKIMWDEIWDILEYISIYISYKLKDTYMASRCFIFYMGILECINYMASIVYLTINDESKYGGPAKSCTNTRMVETPKSGMNMDKSHPSTSAGFRWPIHRMASWMKVYKSRFVAPVISRDIPRFFFIISLVGG